MAKYKQSNRASLEARFDFAEDSLARIEGLWDSHLRLATGYDDGEPYLVRLFRKSGTTLDDDLKAIIARGLRRIRRVLSSRQAREVLVEVLEIAEDAEEIAIVMVDPGSPVAGTARRRAKQGRFLTSGSRVAFWSNIKRIAEALALCHSAGIVHGAVSQYTIFSQSDDSVDYRLGGIEACVHIADGSIGESGHLLRTSGAVSFRQDWIDLARVIASILDLDGKNSPSLLTIERRMIDRLANPPQFQLFDGSVVLEELQQIITELGRVGSSSDGELILYPSRGALQSDLPSLSSGTIPATDSVAIAQFVTEDLLSAGVRLVPEDQDNVRILTDLAVYNVKIVSDTVGMIKNAHKRHANDWMLGAKDIINRIHLSRNRASAEQRVQNLGPGVKRWRDFSANVCTSGPVNDEPMWFALILLEAFTLLREQFRLYPVEVLSLPNTEQDVVWLLSRDDAPRDQQRETMKLRPAAEALRRELRYDDGKANWTVSKSSNLATGGERLPELSYEGRDFINGKVAFAFTTNITVPAGQFLYLRPRKDKGADRAIRRRLQNIVAARSNLELLRALDDPTQVAMDEALRAIAAPGAPPADAEMDPSKVEAWTSIVAGRSINVVVGPPGVGKTFLISHLIKSILGQTPDARVLVSAQNHETLIHMEEELRKFLPEESTIVVRVERSRVGEEESTLRRDTVGLLRSIAKPNAKNAAVMQDQLSRINQSLSPVDQSEQAMAERSLRDTDNLVLRSSDVTLATTSSSVLEEMIADGEQFDWVFIEEAARANGAEMIGALLLGNRRVMIGDHNQLSPFDAEERQKFYTPERSEELLKGAKEKLSTISDLPDEIDVALDALNADHLLLADVLAISSRFEEPFKSIADREAERTNDTNRPSSIANMLREQSRMHPVISDLVSNTFYNGTLVSSARVEQRESVVEAINGFPNSPIVVLDMPSLSVLKRRAFEHSVQRSYRNESEAVALLAALKELRPILKAGKKRPTLAVLSPYSGQVSYLRRLLKPQIDVANRTLFGFASPRDDGKFVFTSDSFQGSEADVIAASLVRNNVLVGSRALGFMKNPQRLNVLLSRAKHKLILAGSRQFIRNAVDGIDPDSLKEDFGFLRRMLEQIEELSKAHYQEAGGGVTIVTVDEDGSLPR